MSHTPLPWVAQPHDNNWGQYEPIEIIGSDGRCVACNTQYYPTGISPDNARFIVERVNAHDELVAALRDARQFIENGTEYGFIDMPDDGDPAHETLPKIKAALAKAGA